MAGKEISAISLFSLAIRLALPTASASSASFLDLNPIVSSFDDPWMDAENLAFYLAAHESMPNLSIEIAKSIRYE